MGQKKKARTFLFSFKGNFQHRTCPTLHRTSKGPSLFPFLSHHLLSSPQHNNSNYVQTTKHANSNDITDTGKLAHLHNNKCRFEPIESLLTFKWYKDVISKVCAYPVWLSNGMCREWSNRHVTAYPAFLCATLTTLLTALCNWEAKWVGGIRKGGGIVKAHRSESCGRGGRRWVIEEKIRKMLSCRVERLHQRC